MTATMTASRVSVARVSSEHLPALTEFYRRVWDPTATVDKVQASRAEAAASNPATPGEPPPTWLVLQDGVAIAHLTTIPVRVWVRGEDLPAHWLKGLWVLPEFQRSSAGFLVLRAAVAALDRTLALVHEPAAIRLFQAMGLADLGGLPNDLRVLRSGALLSRLDLGTLGLQRLPRWLQSAVRFAQPLGGAVGPLVDGATRLWAGIRTGPHGDLTIGITPKLDRDGADALWSEARVELMAGQVRSGGALAHRYVRGSEYVFVEARQKDRLVGLGIVKRPRDEGDPRLGGIRVATLSDLLYRPTDGRAGLAVLRGAEDAARALGADALLSGASAAATAPLVRRRGYLGLPGNLRVLARFKGEPVVPAQLGDWWVTRGDSEGDGTF